LQQVRNASSDKSNQDPRVKKLMAKIISYNNVPRKEAKFKVGIQYYFMLTLSHLCPTTSNCHISSFRNSVKTALISEIKHYLRSYGRPSQKQG
jgi:hypothetical protein